MKASHIFQRMECVGHAAMGIYRQLRCMGSIISGDTEACILGGVRHSSPPQPDTLDHHCAPPSGSVLVVQGSCETLWELAGLATTGTHGGYNDSPE